MTYKELYKSCDPVAKAEGAQWYIRAHDHCRKISHETGYDVNIVAAVISALSPRVRWMHNLQWGAKVLKAARIRQAKAPDGYPGYSINMRKAWAIARKECTPEDAFDVVKAPKTWSFWRNLRDPDEWHPVTIDHWMLRARAWNKRPTWPTYNLLAEEIRETAREFGIIPNVAQATLWSCIRAGYQFRPLP